MNLLISIYEHEEVILAEGIFEVSKFRSLELIVESKLDNNL